MSSDYYAFCQEKLTAAFAEMEGAYLELKRAADDKDHKAAKRKAEDKVKTAAGKVVEIEPHLACLWYEVHDESHDDELRNSIRDAWRAKQTVKPIPLSFRFQPDIASLKHLPRLSFALCIPFRLRKPYLSRDERDFYLLDNPVRKEKIFQTPMVSSTSWKGVLRNVMSTELAAWWNGLSEQLRAERRGRKEFVRKRLQLSRLFGNERDVADDDKNASYLDKAGGCRLAHLYLRYVRRFVAADGFFAARLRFYSTFFVKDKVALEVINPHGRPEGTGKRPILMESVPARAEGELAVAYVPFGPIEQSEEKKRAEVAEDLFALAQGIHAMLTVYGFGAKTSSGFGVTEDRLAGRGTLAIHAALPNLALSQAAEAKPKTEPLPRYLESPSILHRDFLAIEGNLKSEAEYQALLKSRDQHYGKKNHLLYDKAREWWEKRQTQLAAESSPGVVTESPKPEAAPLASIEFESLTKLLDTAKAVRMQLLRGETA